VKLREVTGVKNNRELLGAVEKLIAEKKPIMAKTLEKFVIDSQRRWYYTYIIKRIVHERDGSSNFTKRGSHEWASFSIL
jgi:hypothetical protein